MSAGVGGGPTCWHSCGIPASPRGLPHPRRSSPASSGCKRSTVTLSQVPVPRAKTFEQCAARLAKDARKQLPVDAWEALSRIGFELAPGATQAAALSAAGELIEAPQPGQP